ncbi:MAG: hypothetical protein BWX64_02512 [Acidobacteria bacterium ADurb.Bin051]|jgi:hypothetical protein|nr:MAG: hypothetical protein BWX64_02512 [Acidobacteria bacterium ADurb.Bin051]
MRHLHPCTKEPRGPLWVGLVLLAAGLLGLALLLTGCGSAISAGPRFASSQGLGYHGVSAGLDAVVERPGVRVEAAVSSAHKEGSKEQGGAELRVLGGKEWGAWGLWSGLRGAVQRSDAGTVKVWNPTIGASWRAAESARFWLLWDAPDSSDYDTQALVWRGEYELERIVLVTSLEQVWYGHGQDGQGAGLAILWRWE